MLHCLLCTYILPVSSVVAVQNMKKRFCLRSTGVQFSTPLLQISVKFGGHVDVNESAKFKPPLPFNGLKQEFTTIIFFFNTALKNACNSAPN